jgi:hypothetical protein
MNHEKRHIVDSLQNGKEHEFDGIGAETMSMNFLNALSY